jgi:proteic killer suppression protein
VIKSFRDSDTEQIFNRQFVKKLPTDIQQRAFIRLNALDAAVRLEDLRLPPSNRLEALKGDRKGEYSIRTMTSGEFVSFGEMGMRNVWK